MSNKRNQFMKNFSRRILIAVLIFGLFVGIAPFSTKAQTTFVTLDTPVEGETYYNDEPFAISWPSGSFAGPIDLYFRTEAQESLPPSAGGTTAFSLPENTTSFIMTPFRMESIPVDRYKLIVVCGEDLCGETGYFNIEARPQVDLGIPFVPATSTVSVVVNVINNDAGGSAPSDFTISVNAGNPSSASFAGSTNPTEVIIDAGSYDVTGSASAGYTLSYSNCSGVSLVGVIIDCTLTYNDVTYVPNGGGQGDEEGEGIIPNGQGGNNNDEGDGIIPNGQGGNDNDEGDGIIPNGQGSNDNEGDGIIPNGQGSNGPEGDPDVQGSNGDEIIVAESQNTRSGSSSTGSSRKTTIVSSATSLPALSDIGSCTYIKDYLNIKSSNDPAEVTKLQTFMNEVEGIEVGINGIFDQATLAAVKAFQTKYLDDVMVPWGLQTASGIVSYTTKKKINEIYCKTTFSLTPEQLAAIERYKNELSSPDEEFVAPSDIEVGFAEPETINTPVVAEQTEEIPVVLQPQQTQTASALDASEGFFQRIMNFFKNLF